MGAAPLKVASVTGYQDPQGFITLTSTVDAQPVEIVSRGSSRLIGSGSRWEIVSDQPTALRGASHDLRQFPAAQTPVEELRSIKLGQQGQPQSDGGYLAPLDTLTAASRMNAFVRRHGPVPLTSTAAEGTVQWWVKEGQLRRYILTLSGTLRLLIGSKRLTITSTTEITDIGLQPSASPAAIARLDQAGDPKPTRH